MISQSIAEQNTPTGITYGEAKLFLHNAVSCDNETYADLIVLICFAKPSVENLRDIDSMLDCSHGVETLCDETLGHLCDYVNTGDTYDETIALIDGAYLLTCWGSVYEEAEQAHCEENAVYHCANCGSYTPIIEGKHWNDTHCESCNALVCG